MSATSMRPGSYRNCGVIAGFALAAALLISCGGQSSDPRVQSNPQQNAVEPDGSTGSAPNLSLLGAYQGTASGSNSEFVSFVTPDLKFYLLFALNFQVNNHIAPPIIYTGSVQPDATTTTVNLSVRSYQSQNKFQSGTATATAASGGAHILALSDTVHIDGLDLTPQFNSTSVATTADSLGTWTGTWADGLDGSVLSDASFSLIGTANTPSPARIDVGYCHQILLDLTPAINAGTIPYFLATATIPPNQTNCRRSNTTLSGIAFVHASRTGLKSLEIIVVDQNGGGISFRGSQ